LLQPHALLLQWLLQLLPRLPMPQGRFLLLLLLLRQRRQRRRLSGIPVRQLYLSRIVKLKSTAAAADMSNSCSRCN
jgi:hypothetical protein